MQHFNVSENLITNSDFGHLNFAEVSFLIIMKMSHNWHNYNKKLTFSDEKNTRKIDAFFSKQKSSKKSELKVDEQKENRPSSFNTVTDLVVQSKSRPSASTWSAEM